jgi:hypothetical protein
LAECAQLVARGARENFVWARLGDVAVEFMTASRDEEVYVARAGGEIIGVAALYRPGNFVHYCSSFRAGAARASVATCWRWSHARGRADLAEGRRHEPARPRVL